MELEAAISRDADAGGDPCFYPFNIKNTPTACCRYLDPTAMWIAVLDDLLEGTPIVTIGRRFHRGLSVAILEMVLAISRSDQTIRKIALSGGCFQNTILLEDVVARLEAEGFTCLTQARFPANDGGLALGQAAIGAARHKK
jgi:hydrogenase maturation protein HypF